MAVLDDHRAVSHVAADMEVAARMGEAYEAAQRGDYPTALAIWGPLAHAGVARAQNNVGACFAEGLGVERDYSLVLRWLTGCSGLTPGWACACLGLGRGRTSPGCSEF